MPAWPNIQMPSGLEEENENPVVRSEMESGIVVTRPRYTRVRRTFNLDWANLNGADYRILRAFYFARKGGGEAFTWQHPKENINLTVRFNGELRAKHTVMDFWNVNIKLEQV